MNTNILREHNLNYLAGIIGIILLLRTMFVTFSHSDLYINYNINLILLIFAGVMCISSMLLFKKDYRLSIFQYTIGCVAILVSSIGGMYALIFILLAIFLAYAEREKSENILNNYTNNDIEQQNAIKNERKKLILIPCISLILLAILISSSLILTDIEENNRANAINIAELEASPQIVHNFPQVNITGKLISSETFSSVSVVTYWYDESGSQIAETYDSGIHYEIKENQSYALNSKFYGHQGDKLPSRAEIVVKDLKHNKKLYSKNVTF